MLRTNYALNRAFSFILTFIGVFAFMTTSAAQSAKSPPPGPTDAEGFTFLDGNWKVHHQKLKEPMTGRTEWNTFQGTAKFFSAIDGLMSVEDLRDANNKPYGGAVRTFNRETRQWADAWMPASTGVLQGAQHGRFENGVGTFGAEDEFNGKPILVRGIWKRVNKDEVTWEQAASADQGKTWETNWKMRFERIVETAPKK
jgi:hypothetical protein